MPYILLCLPSFVVEFYLDRLGRPSYAADGALRRSGHDLDAKGWTEYMWDVLYWTWINLVLVIFLGNWAWCLYLIVPVYSLYLATTMVGGMRGMLPGLAGAGGEEAPSGTGNSERGESKRQKRTEKRGGQRVAYRQ